MKQISMVYTNETAVNRLVSYPTLVKDVLYYHSEIRLFMGQIL